VPVGNYKKEIQEPLTGPVGVDAVELDGERRVGVSCSGLAWGRGSGRGKRRVHDQKERRKENLWEGRDAGHKEPKKKKKEERGKNLREGQK